MLFPRSIGHRYPIFAGLIEAIECRSLERLRPYLLVKLDPLKGILVIRPHKIRPLINWNVQTEERLDNAEANCSLTVLLCNRRFTDCAARFHP